MASFSQAFDPMNGKNDAISSNNSHTTGRRHPGLRDLIDDLVEEIVNVARKPRMKDQRMDDNDQEEETTQANHVENSTEETKNSHQGYHISEQEFQSMHGAIIDILSLYEQHEMECQSHSKFVTSVRLRSIINVSAPYTTNRSSDGLLDKYFRTAGDEAAHGPNLLDDFNIVAEMTRERTSLRIDDIRERFGMIYGVDWPDIQQLVDPEGTFANLNTDQLQKPSALETTLCQVFCGYHYIYYALRSDLSPQLREYLANVEDIDLGTRMKQPLSFEDLPKDTSQIKSLLEDAGCKDKTFEDSLTIAKKTVKIFMGIFVAANTAREAAIVGDPVVESLPFPSAMALPQQSIRYIILFIRLVRHGVLDHFRDYKLPFPSDASLWRSLCQTYPEYLKRRPFFW